MVEITQLLRRFTNKKDGDDGDVPVRYVSLPEATRISHHPPGETLRCPTEAVQSADSCSVSWPNYSVLPGAIKDGSLSLSQKNRD